VEQSLTQIYRDLGSPSLGSMSLWPEYIDTDNTRRIKRDLDLDDVPYPFPGGSWDDYIDYVKNNSTLGRHGYRRKYGILTWIDYLQSQHPSHADSPGLWRTSEQPLTAVKDAVDLFLAYIQDKSPDDQVAFSLYSSGDNTAILESGLTRDFAAVANLVRRRQAGHYVGGTNIYDGLRLARQELQNNARVGAQKLIVLMTDGYANLPGNAATARSLVLSEAQAAADAGIKIIAIALGSDADTALMEEVASISGGASFIIPGGSSVSEYEEELKEVFREVAADRPLELVQ
jgi:hypothetical protein